MTADSKRTPKPRSSRGQRPASANSPSTDDTNSAPTGGPQFGEPSPTPDPTKFTVKHGSDKEAYKILDSEKSKLRPLPFPIVKGQTEPALTLAEALGSKGKQIVGEIQKAGQIVFHSVGDSGNVRGPKDENMVADKMVSDFSETDPRSVPSFFYHLGDIVYSFGEAQYYYDQFYDTYRDYPAPIFAVPGNHDGMLAPNSKAHTLDAFLLNFCAGSDSFQRTPEAGGLARTAQIQPAVYFTLEAPFVRILGVYSNRLEDPGVISDQGGEYPELTNVQLSFLKAALTRIKNEKFAGAVLIAVHHPPYTAVAEPGHKSTGRHGSSPKMLKDIDSACTQAGVWPHAILSGHAHTYQRFTRTKDGRETPFVVAGNGGHGIVRLTHKGNPTLRTPMKQPSLSDGSDDVVFENYDDQDFGYLRILVNTKQLRIEYHPAPDGENAKTPDDSVTVDLATRKIVRYQTA